MSTGGGKPRVLVVDDEEHITELVAMGLGYNGFDCERVASGRSALEAVEHRKPDLIVLDVMLPDLDGFEVARRLRTNEGAGTRVPIIFLTARDTTADKVRGLTLGADDYVTKPFSLEELVARVKAVLRRAGAVDTAGTLQFSDVELDEQLHEVRRDGHRIDLSPTEFKLLRYFLRHPRIVLSKAQILDHVWEYDFGGDANVVETYVSYLRRKLDTGGPQLIHTVRGVGYALRVSE